MMKKYMIAVVAALLAVPAFAQNERHYEYDEYGQVGRKEGWARRFAHNFYDAVVGAEYYEVVDESGKQTEKKPVSKKEQKNVSKTYRYYGPGHTPDFYFGVNLLTTDDPMVMTPGLPQKQGKGFELGFAVGQWGYHMTRNIGINRMQKGHTLMKWSMFMSYFHNPIHDKRSVDVARSNMIPE